MISFAATADDLQGQLRDALTASGVVDADALDRGISAAARTGNRLDKVLLELGIATESTLRRVLVDRLGVLDYDGELSGPEHLGQLIPPEYAASSSLVPVRLDAAHVVLAMLDPFDDFAVKAIRLKLGRPVLRRSATSAQFQAAFETLYGFPLQADDEGKLIGREQASDGDLDTIRDSASDAPVIRFVQNAVKLAVETGASDIHIRPSRHRAEMLFRIDGQLQPQNAPDATLLPAILSRLKILANLDISERRLPQDGRIRINVGGQPIDIRLSTMPHIHGEGAVLRLLSRDAGVTSLGELGFSAPIRAGLEALFDHTEGLILVTGPTGSGKSTTLHAALKRLIRPELNVVTIEDPVEYRIDGAAQVQVDEKIGLTFPRVLRSMLRQDPDIILIGEIRDAETAKIAVQASLTGHLVLATLHTNSAVAAVPRLVDMGVEPYLLAAVLRGVLSQRLVRKKCRDCASAPGCATCGGSGTIGRVAVGELVTLDGGMTERLSKSTTVPPDLMAELRARGFVPLAEDAAHRAAAGDIAPAELTRVLANAE